MPDTAEQEWLDRHGIIWLTNSDGSKGRKGATYAKGTIQFTGGQGSAIPIGTLLGGGGISQAQYQTITAGIIGIDGLGVAEATALLPGSIGNLPSGSNMDPAPAVPGIESAVCLGDMSGGVDIETDEQLRERILLRIQNPPMGGSQMDYVNWAMAVPGVTRAWAAPEIGPGTMTVRFLMDDLYPENYGLPQEADIEAVFDYVNSKRPVTVLDCFVMAPILYFYDVTISELTKDDATTRGYIEESLKDMEFERSKPGQTWYRSWVDEAVSQAVGEQTHELAV